MKAKISRPRSKGKQVACALLLVALVLTLLSFKHAQAQPLQSASPAIGKLCGRLVFITQDSGGTAIGLEQCNTGKTYIFDQSPAELYNFYQFSNVTTHTEAPAKGDKHATAILYITGWTDYRQINSCSECNNSSTGSPTLTPAPAASETVSSTTPLATQPPATSGGALTIANGYYEPNQPSQYSLVKIHVLLENKGTPITDQQWDYTGQVILKGTGEGLPETHNFARDNGAVLSPNPANSQANVTQQWELVIQTRFAHVIDKGDLEVVIQPKDLSVSPQSLVAPISIQANKLDARACAALVAGKLGSPLANDNDAKLALDAAANEATAKSCAADDLNCNIPPYAKAIAKILARQNDPAKEMAAMWGVFDNDAIQVCATPANWLWQIAREMNMQGLAANVLWSQSSATVLVTNPAGQRAGFLEDGKAATEIPNSYVANLLDQKLVLYPAQEATIQLHGSDQGNLTLNALLGKGSNREAIRFENVPVTAKTVAQLDMSGDQAKLLVQNNGDGTVDKTLAATSSETLPIAAQLPPTVQPTATSTGKKPALPCIPSMALPVLPLIVFFVRKLQK